MPPESCGKRCITIDAKRIALFEVKLLSRDKVMYTPYKLTMLFSLWRHLWLQTSAEENPMIPGNSWKFEHKGGDRANESSSMFGASHFHENKCLSEIIQRF